MPGLKLRLGLGLTRGGGAGLPAIIQTGLVAEWRFDDGSGQQLTDYSGNGHHGQLGSTSGADTNDPTWGTSPARLSFDGTDDIVLTSDIVQDTQEFHLEVIARLPSDAPDFATITRFNDTGGDMSSPSQIFRNGSTNKLEWKIGDGSSAVSPDGTIVAWDGNWHHLVFDVQENSGALINTFVDDVLDVELQHTASLVDSTDAVVIGAKKAGSANFPFKGDIAYQLYYNRHLSDAERAQNRDTLKSIMAGRGITLP